MVPCLYSRSKRHSCRQALMLICPLHKWNHQIQFPLLLTLRLTCSPLSLRLRLGDHLDPFYRLRFRIIPSLRYCRRQVRQPLNLPLASSRRGTYCIGIILRSTAKFQVSKKTHELEYRTGEMRASFSNGENVRIRGTERLLSQISDGDALEKHLHGRFTTSDAADHTRSFYSTRDSF